MSSIGSKSWIFYQQPNVWPFQFSITHTLSRQKIYCNQLSSQFNFAVFVLRVRFGQLHSENTRKNQSFVVEDKFQTGNLRKQYLYCCRTKVAKVACKEPFFFPKLKGTTPRNLVGFFPIIPCNCLHNMIDDGVEE